MQKDARSNRSRLSDLGPGYGPSRLADTIVPIDSPARVWCHSRREGYFHNVDQGPVRGIQEVHNMKTKYIVAVAL